MGRMNIYLSPEEDKKIERLKERFKKKSKEDVIKSLIKQFPEQQDDILNIEKETSMGDLI